MSTPSCSIKESLIVGAASLVLTNKALFLNMEIGVTSLLCSTSLDKSLCNRTNTQIKRMSRHSVI